jgi:hypothetical protein
MATEAKASQVAQVITTTIYLGDDVVYLSLSLVGTYPSTYLALPSISNQHLRPRGVPRFIAVSPLGCIGSGYFLVVSGLDPRGYVGWYPLGH